MSSTESEGATLPEARELPEFTSEEEEREWWAGHDTSELAGQDVPLQFSGSEEHAARILAVNTDQHTVNRLGRAIAEFCRRHYIRRLSLFGSVSRGDFRADSDLDVLVEFDPGHVPGFGFVDLAAELSNLFGRRVDLNTPNSLSPYFRDRVLAEAQVLYAR